VRRDVGSAKTKTPAPDCGDGVEIGHDPHRTPDAVLRASPERARRRNVSRNPGRRIMSKDVSATLDAGKSDSWGGIRRGKRLTRRRRDAEEDIKQRMKEGLIGLGRSVLQNSWPPAHFHRRSLGWCRRFGASLPRHPPFHFSRVYHEASENLFQISRFLRVSAPPRESLYPSAYLPAFQAPMAPLPGAFATGSDVGSLSELSTASARV